MKEREERLLPEMTNEDRRKMLYLEETGGLPTQIDRSRDLFFRFLLGCPSRLNLLGDLLNNLFRHPYTRIEAVVNDIGVSRQTASKYLKQLQEIGILTAQTRGKNTYFVNEPLVQLISEGE